METNGVMGGKIDTDPTPAQLLFPSASDRWFPYRGGES